MNAASAEHAVRRQGLSLGALLLILVVAAALRLHGLNWDEGQLFHPDERWIVIVAADLHLPPTFAGLAPPASSLNPFWDQQAGISRDFAYGHFPLYLLRLAAAAAVPLAPDPLPPTYEYLVLIGRLLAVLADVATVALTYALGRELFGVGTGLVAAAGVALATLHVQLAHFYTVDPLLTALVMAALLAMTAVARRGSTRASVAAGVVAGLAVGTKSSAILLLFPLVVAHMIDGFDATQQTRLGRLLRGPARLRAAHELWSELDEQRGWRGLLPALGAGLLAFVLTNPYTLAEPARYFASVSSQSGLVQGRWVLPYTEQYRGSLPYLYFVGQQFRWFLGPALGLLAWSGFLWIGWRLFQFGLGIFDFGLRSSDRSGQPTTERRQSPIQSREWPTLVWGLSYFALVGAFFVKFPRYLEPLTPLLLIWGAALLLGVTRQRPATRVALLGALFVPAALYALAFTNVYRERHPWIQASEWIYRHVPPGATILVEQWDHPLPVSMAVDGEWHRGREYRQVTVDPFDTASAAKSGELVRHLSEADWVVLSSPRGWGVLRRLGDEYPLMPEYYQALLTGAAGFEIAGVWRVEPQVGPVALSHNPFVSAGLPTPPAWEQATPARWMVDLGFADESFTVYDHPMPIVLRKTELFETETLRARLWPSLQATELENGSH